MIKITAAVRKKLATKHGVAEHEVVQCLQNLDGCALEDTREEHKTDPPTKWIISPTNKKRLLKVVFVFKDGDFHIKTAYEPSRVEIELYENNAY